MMSINERRKEIGVLKVLGSEMTDIMFMFMVEALLVGIAGGLFGMGLSFGMRELIPVLFSDMDVRSIIPVWLVVVGLGFSGIVALLSALAPAIGAMRISPLEAIRRSKRRANEKRTIRDRFQADRTQKNAVSHWEW